MKTVRRRYFKETVRICLGAIICFAVGILLMLIGWSDFPWWWYWSILLWLTIPYYLMVFDLRRATDVSREEREKWELALVRFGIGRFVVPFFYFLAERKNTRRQSEKVRTLIVPLALAAFMNGGCSKIQADRNLNRAGELYSQGRYAEALKLYQEVIRLQPEFGAGYCGLGNTWRQLNRSDDAIGAYQDAIRLEPTYVRCRYPLAVLLYERGKYDAAQHEFEMVKQQDGEICESSVYLALIAHLKNDGSKAARLFDSAPQVCIDRVPDGRAVYDRVKAGR